MGPRSTTAHNTDHEERPLYRRAHRLLVTLLTLGLSVAMTGGCGGGASSENSDGASSDSAAADTTKKKKSRKEKKVSVNAANVIRGELVLPVIAEGSIRARRSADILAEVGGRVDQILVQEGQAIRAGDVIAMLDGREFTIEYEEARTRYVKALGQLAIEEGGLEEGLQSLDPSEGESELSDAIAELDRLEQRGEISRDQRLTREIALELAAIEKGAFRADLLAVRSGLASARADVERAKLKLERTTITAPFDGVVSGLDLSRGEQVTLNETICTLIDNIDIEAVVGVLESDLGTLEVGRPALLDVPALGETLLVTVDVISPQVQRDTRTCQVLMRLKSPDGRVKPGMFVRTAIAGRVYPDRLMVPNEAILTRDGRPLVFKIEDDVAKWLYVTLGERNDNVVEIAKVLQGGPLEPGDKVVVSNHLTLTHDAKLRVKKTLDPKDPWAAIKN